LRKNSQHQKQLHHADSLILEKVASMAISALLVILSKIQLFRWTVLEDRDLDP
jgi:hypothetical protein